MGRYRWELVMTPADRARDVVICSPLRTPVGRYGGVFAGVPAASLAAAAISALVQRTGVDPALIDDVILGQCYPSGEAPALGRVAALDAGLPVEVPGVQLDRRCGSGLQAVIWAVMQVQAGAGDVVLAGGAESMSQAEFYSPSVRWGPGGEQIVFHDRLARARVTAGGMYHPVPGGMLETAENLRRDYHIARQEQDEFALRSHQRAVAAQEAGRFEDEIVPVEVAGRRGTSMWVTRDEHPRADTSLESLGRLRPILGRQDSGATVTAGNASGQNDGASICLVTTRAMAGQLGIEPMARLISWAVAGVPPATMGIGPVPAVARALGRAGVELRDVDLIELNEAFAAQVLACTREWKFASSDFDRLNVNGSGISLGHPVGATGGRILATLLHELARRGQRFGLETMCIGGGQGLAALFERAG
jgi:acetyl-CoA C-acetyltransferase